ncbi:hypothetical protein FUAX_06880 [Fulvitalea axinellae]|uniref:Lipocalin-like domain-containing protein n=1 Tax=Fulvitalea axinellae TaxID=1182444 RepID=A0AAU9C827_9BACT|nr:hypothetical protein FUAX_06880 [Fulvitalea axinellae]
MKHFLLLIIFCCLFSCQRNAFIGKWHAPNHVVTLDFQKGATIVLRCIGCSGVDTLGWRKIGRNFAVVEGDTFRIKDDRIPFLNTFLSKGEVKADFKIDKSYFLNQRFVHGNGEFSTSVHFPTEEEYTETFNKVTDTKQWDLIEFEGNHFLGLTVFRGGRMRYCRIVEKKEDRLKLLYFDNHEQKFVESEMRKVSQ